MQKFFVAACIILLTACSTVYQPIPPSETEPANTEARGYIVGSISHAGDFPEGTSPPLGVSKTYRHNFYNFQFRNKNHEENYIGGSISTIPSNMWGNYENDEADFKIDQGRAYIFVIAMPPGNYEFFSYYFGNGNRQTVPAEEFSLPFSVEANSVHYMGNFHFQHRFHKNLFGMTVSTDANIGFTDEEQRDLELIFQRYPYLKALNYDYQLIGWPK